MEKKSKGLRKSITLFVLAGISTILFSLGVVSHFIIQRNIEDSLNKRLVLSRLNRNNIDNIITDNINRLYDISLSGSVDLNDNNFGPEKSALESAYRYSLFTDGVFLIDRGGNIILNYPERIRETALNILSIEPVSRMLSLGKPVVSNIYTMDTGKKILYFLVPLKDKNGGTVGAAGGQIDPTNPTLIQKLGLSDLGRNMFIDIVDSNGVIISSSDAGRILTQCNRDKFFTRSIATKSERVATCHVCHVDGDKVHKHKTILAFIPLETAPWGISIQESEEDVFTPAAKLKRTFAALGAIFIGTAFMLTIGINRSIVGPLNALIRGADRIAKGDLSKPIPPQGSDEIGVLGQSFETMRVRLLGSMERIQAHTHELEDRVVERTGQIKESQKRAELLLQKLIKTQEEERKRIARELHDDTLQDLSAALMRIDMCKLFPDQITPEKADEIHGIILHALDGVTAIIQNMRPSLLDDLGLAAAIKSLLDRHIGEKGAQYFITMRNVADLRFQPEIETTLYRIIQEAVTNIARHAEAENVFVIFKLADNAIHVEIEDDGIGFDQKAVSALDPHDLKDRRGLGLLGMKERAFLINGTIEVCSLPGLGTSIEINIPLSAQEGSHA